MKTKFVEGFSWKPLALLSFIFNFSFAMAAQPKLANRDFRSHGFWGDGPSHFLAAAPRRFFPQSDHLAILSRGCSQVRTEQISACSHFDEVDLLVSFGDELSTREIVRGQQEHPWWSRPQTSPHVLAQMIHRSSDLDSIFRSLLGECKLVRYLFFSGHGMPGSLQFGEGMDGAVSTISFLSEVHLPCALSPGARVQFDHCHQTCRWQTSNNGERQFRNGATEIRSALQILFGNPALRDRGFETHRDTRFLFHSQQGLVSHDGTRLYFDWIYNRLGVHDWDGHPFLLTIEDSSNQAVEYRIENGFVSADRTDLSEVPECGVE